MRDTDQGRRPETGTRRQRGWRNGLIGVAALTLTGCANVQLGDEFDLATFTSRVETGTTTQADIREWLGAPDGQGIAVETDGARYDEWTYYYGHGRLPRMADAELKLLQVRFDRDGIVRGYNWSGPVRRDR